MPLIGTFGGAASRAFGLGSAGLGGGGPIITDMNQLTITGAAPIITSVSTAWGWAGPTESLTAPTTSRFSINFHPTERGVRIILQAGGGASSNNDADGDSSANSGATCVFDLPPWFTGLVDFWIGPSGPNYSSSGGAQVNVNPRQIPGITNPLGAYPVSPGQGGFAGNASFDAAVMMGSTILGYAEGGGATLNFDSANPNQSRAYVNTGSATSVAVYNGPVSPGRGVAPEDDSFPNWNFNIYSSLATCFGKYASIAASRYGKGGREAAVSSSGYSGYPGFVWVSLL